MTLDTSRVIWLLVVQAVGLGIATMPIMTGGIAVIPLTHVNVASACNSVVQRISGALGIAALTVILTTHQAQQLAARAALLPTGTPTPDLAPTAPPVAGLYAKATPVQGKDRPSERHASPHDQDRRPRLAAVGFLRSFCWDRGA